MKALRLLIGLLLVGSLMGCMPKMPTVSDAASPVMTTEPVAPPTEAPTEVPSEPKATEPEPTEPADYVDSLVQGMSLREKVGQLFIVHPDSLVPTPEDPKDCVKDFTAELAAGMETYPVGGFVIFGDNLRSPDQIHTLNAELQSHSRIPLFLCVDEEGGLVSRLANHKAFDLPKYRNAATVGKSGDPAKAMEMGRAIGTYLAEYGFNVDFAPVADVNTNPKNSVIGNRAFSSKPETAGQMAAAMAEGLREQSIIPTFKHFPGHGDTAEDSHTAIAVSNKTLNELENCELIPFQSATRNDFVMVGHIAVPAISGNNTPATMSREIVTGLLREELEFEGLIITDSLEMGAITELYESDRVALAALEAGCDILLMPANLETAFEAIVKAVENGQYSQAQLDTTVERILRFKERNGLLGIG